MGPRGARYVAAWATAAFVVLQLGWILVMPPATGIDEFDHIYRASAVSMGHWEPGAAPEQEDLARGGFLPVHDDLVDAAGPACARLLYTKEFNCRPFHRLSPDVVEVASGVDDYNPAFYTVVGTIAKPFTGNTAIYVIRIVSGALCAAAFAVAMYLTQRWARTRWPAIALCLACLPTTAYSASLAAPNGLNMMSGLLIWASLAALWSRVPEIRTSAYVALMVGVAILVDTHTLGILWAGLIAAALIVHSGPSAALALLRPRARLEAATLLIAVSATAFQLFWLVYAQPNTRPEGGLTGDPWGLIGVSLIVWPLQAVGAFPMRNEAAPLGVYAMAVVVLGAFAAVAVRSLKQHRALLRMALLVLFWSAVIPIGITYVTFHDYGLSWQGRYGMPLAVGLFVIAGMTLDRHDPRATQPVIVVGTVTWGLAHVLGQLHVLAQQRADTQLVAATGWWVTPPLVVVLAGLAATAAWLGAFRAATPAPAVAMTGAAIG